MNLNQCILKANDCYIASEWITPSGVMVHSTGANNPSLGRYVQPLPSYPNYDELISIIGYNRNGNSWNRTGTNACVHAFIGKLADGSIASVQTLPWNMRGWHAGNGTTRPSANNTHISFEICEDGLDDEDYFGKAYREAVELTAHLCTLYGLDPMEDGVVICHSEGCRLGMASNHADVEHWFPKFGKSMDDFRADVKAEMEDNMFSYDQWKVYMSQYRKELQDNDCGDWSKEAREWAVSVGLFGGSGTGEDGQPNMMWQDQLSREQAAQIFYRFARLNGMA